MAAMLVWIRHKRCFLSLDRDDLQIPKPAPWTLNTEKVVLSEAFLAQRGISRWYWARHFSLSMASVFGSVMLARRMYSSIRIKKSNSHNIANYWLLSPIDFSRWRFCGVVYFLKQMSKNILWGKIFTCSLAGTTFLRRCCSMRGTPTQFIIN
jgi:hypothetical protein